MVSSLPKWNTTAGTIALVTTTTAVVATGVWMIHRRFCTCHPNKNTTATQTSDTTSSTSMGRHPTNNTSWESRVVGPHGPLREVWSQVLYALEAPGCSQGPPVRNMTIYRVPDSNVKNNNHRLVIYNGVSIDDATIGAIEALGTPTILVVPNRMHREDAAIWKNKYPHLQVVCPSYCTSKVVEVVPVDMSVEDWVAMEEWSKWIKIKAIDGWGDFEFVLEVQLETPSSNKVGKIAVVVCDLLFTLPYKDKYSWTDHLIAWFFDCNIVLPPDPSTTIIVPKVSRIARIFGINDWKKVERWYRTYAQEYGKLIAVILVGHGVPVVQVDAVDGCTKALEGVADQLIKPRW
jgi:hypothetical protein